ncbi:MAG: universal stress protein [Desulfobacterales bacterium]
MTLDVNTILCAIDFSRFSPAVLDYAAGIARGFGARVAVFHALNVPGTRLPDEALCNPGADAAEQVENTRLRIKNLVADRPIDWYAVIGAGDPVEAIEMYLHDHDVGLVMAASYRLSGWKRLLGGTIVEALARSLTRPLLVVQALRASATRKIPSETGVALQNILVACDLTAETDKLFTCAAAFARDFGSRLHFAHTIEAPVAENPPETAAGPYTEVQQTLKDRLHRQLIRRLPESLRSDTPFTAVVLQGNPADSLMDYAAANAIDLIVVGVRPRHGLQKLLIGSTTETLLRRAPCEVLTVPCRDG